MEKRKDIISSRFHSLCDLYSSALLRSSLLDLSETQSPVGQTLTSDGKKRDSTAHRWSRLSSQNSTHKPRSASTLSLVRLSNPSNAIVRSLESADKRWNHLRGPRDIATMPFAYSSMNTGARSGAHCFRKVSFSITIISVYCRAHDSLLCHWSDHDATQRETKRHC